LVTGDDNTIKPYFNRRLILSNYVCSSTLVQSFFIFLITFIASCENKAEDVRNWTRNVTLKEEAYNVESYLSQQGIMKAKLTAPLMIRMPRYDSPYVEFPKTLHVDFYKDSTVLDSWLDSKYGKYYESQNKVYLRDSVVVITAQGDTLKTFDLWWDQTTKMFYTDTLARYFSSSKQIYGGKGLRATQDLKSVVFKYPIGTIKTTDSGF